MLYLITGLIIVCCGIFICGYGVATTKYRRTDSSDGGVDPAVAERQREAQRIVEEADRIVESSERAAENGTNAAKNIQEIITDIRNGNSSKHSNDSNNEQ